MAWSIARHIPAFPWTWVKLGPFAFPTSALESGVGDLEQPPSTERRAEAVQRQIRKKEERREAGQQEDRVDPGAGRHEMRGPYNAAPAGAME